MNKSDLKLIIGVVLIVIVFFLVKFINNDNENKKAFVYYENKLVKTIDLSISGTNYYNIKGYNGNIKIETLNKRIRVVEEKSPLHLCSKQGWVSSTQDVIICLPNKVVIKIKAQETSLDAIVR